MPNLDGTGPQGKGPRTGRGLGNCQPNDKDSSVGDKKSTNQRRGLGLGFRQGNRRRP